MNKENNNNNQHQSNNYKNTHETSHNMESPKTELWRDEYDSKWCKHNPSFLRREGCL